MAPQITTIDDLQSELHILKNLVGIVFWMVREIPYPEDETGRRNHDELTAIAQVAKERMADLDTAIAEGCLSPTEAVTDHIPREPPEPPLYSS